MLMSTSQRHVVRWTTALLLSAVLLAGATGRLKRFPRETSRDASAIK